MISATSDGEKSLGVVDALGLGMEDRILDKMGASVMF